MILFLLFFAAKSASLCSHATADNDENISQIGSTVSITRVDPLYLGEGGGVVLTIDGEGFSKDQFNHFDTELGNRVYLVNEYDSIECDVIKYLTNTRRITCTTRPWKKTNTPRTYKVKVFVDGIPSVAVKEVEYKPWLSPKILGVVPRWSLPGEVVKLEGHFHTDKYDQLVIGNSEESSATGSGQALKRAYIGGTACEIPYDNNTEMYDISTTHIQCLLPGSSFIGAMNVSVFVEKRGASVSFSSSLFVDSQDQLYQYHTYPAIRDVTPVSGGERGGTLLTIDGVGFDPSSGVTEVFVGGAKCDIVDITISRFTCLTPPKNLTGPAPGERGALWEFFEGKEIEEKQGDELWNSLTSSNLLYTQTIPDLEFNTSLSNTSAGRLSGYFHAPHDGVYSFKIKKPKGIRSSLYVAVDGNPENKTFTSNHAQFSLVKKTPAYFEIRFVGLGAGEIQIAVSDFNAKWTASDTAQAFNERQAITLSLGYRNEVQQISFANKSDMTGSISLGGFSSGPINMANPDEVKSGLKSLLEQQCEMTPSDVLFRIKTDFEDEEPLPDGLTGVKEDEVEPYCGRYSWKLWQNHPKIYENTKVDEMIDLTRTPYVCFAIIGNFEGGMRALYNYKDKFGYTRSIEISFDYWEHPGNERIARSTQSSSVNSWDYTCINLLEILRLSSFGKTYAEGTAKLRRLFGPLSRTSHGFVYIDAVSFVSEFVYVTQTRPSALASRGISVLDIDVKSSNQNVGNEEFVHLDIEFKTNCQGGFPLMGVSSSEATMPYLENLDTDEKANFTLGGSTVTVQRVQAATPHVQGNWSLQLQGTHIEGISPDVSNYELEEMVKTALGVDGIRIQQHADKCRHQNWVIHWLEDPGKKELAVANSTGLSFNGSYLLLNAKRQLEGHVSHEPITADFLSVRREEPHVAVTVNGYRSACLGNCAFFYDGNSGPSLQAVGISSGNEELYTLTITGSGFMSSNVNDFMVSLGDGGWCNVIAVTTTMVTCTATNLTAGNHFVSVFMQPEGLARMEKPLSFEVALKLKTIYPSTGGTLGGYAITLVAANFPTIQSANYNVTIGGSVCEVTEVEKSSIKCLVPPGREGAADVVLNINGQSSVLEKGFVYNSSLSPIITSISPEEISILGLETLHISGSGFGTGVYGNVIIGPESCDVLSWTDSEVKCQVPPRLHSGRHFVVLCTDKEKCSRVGFVNVTFKVTSYSPLRGSVYGGTTMVLKGRGFGQNCSLVGVTIGENMTCDVTSCSEDTIRCVTRRIQRRHYIRNTGSLTGYGPGYAWDPQKLSIQEGDAVTWNWHRSSDPNSELLYNVFSTSSPILKEFDEKGFKSGHGTPVGNFTYGFQNSGTYYYASDPLKNSIVMSGQIEVTAPTSVTERIRVTFAGVEADFELDGEAVSVTLDECGDALLSTEAISGCLSDALQDTNQNNPYFVTDSCWTPQITGVSAKQTLMSKIFKGLQVTVRTKLNIEGIGFGSETCKVQVKVGQAHCRLTSVSDERVICVIEDSENLVSLRPLPIRLTIADRGTAGFKVNNTELESQVTIVPSIESFEPKSGSVSGGTLINITGSGFLPYDGRVAVWVGQSTCGIMSLTSSAITCVTKKQAPGTYSLIVQVSSHLIEPVSLGLNLSFTYTETSTPYVQQIKVNGKTIELTGSGFDDDPFKVRITFIPTASREKRSIQKEESGHDDSDENEKVTVEFVNDREPNNKILIYDDVIMSGGKSYEYDGFTETFKYADEIINLHHPVMDTTILDVGEVTPSFWSDFTGTSARSFTQSQEMGLWRVGGTQQSLKYSPESEIHRRKRYVEATTYSCSPNSVTDKSITCTPEDLPAGSYDLTLYIKDRGEAMMTGNTGPVVIKSTIYSISPTEGSINGGTHMTINGSGFVPGNIEVKIDGNSCVLEKAEVTVLVCRTPPHSAGNGTVEVHVAGEVLKGPNFTYSESKTPVISSVTPDDNIRSADELVINGTNFNISGEPEVIIGYSKCDIIDFETTITCQAPELPGGNYTMAIRDPKYGCSNYLEVVFDLSITSVEPAQGGFGGVSINITGFGFDSSAQGTTVTVCNASCIITNSSYNSLRCQVPPTEQGTVETKECDVTVANMNGAQKTFEKGFTYENKRTPSISDVMPKRGGTAGGTRVTISGSGFSEIGNTVTIDDSQCVVVEENTTEISCVTESHQGPGKYPVIVSVPGSGRTITGGEAEFFYIDRWSSTFTWGGEPVPSKGQMVVIDVDQTVLLDQSTDVLKMLLIKGGHVVFDEEASEEIVLRAEYILIVEGGSLNVGTENQPFMGSATIELHGNSRSIELPIFGSKTLAVRNGTLDLHGTPVPVTWTYLAATASPGDQNITLKQQVTWKAGDRIVIASTGRRFTINENEERTINSVSEDGLTLELSEPLDYEHISIEQTIGGRLIETRAEVGLLSRNVKIRGALNEDFVEDVAACAQNFNPGQFATQQCFQGKFGQETSSDMFGATVMLCPKSPDEDLVRGRIEYVEVTDAGQAFQLGRYPVHFHRVGNVTDSYVKGCAVHRTFNRAITMHAVNNLLVEGNVVYNNMGHAIFTEDGIEQNNVIQYNLAIFTRSSSSLLNVDVTPASYWIVNPNNIVRHNAAAGSTHFGYWYRTERNPSGPSATTDYCPYNAPMGVFTNNTAHSVGRYGLWVFSKDGYYPRSDTCRGTAQVAAWHDFTSWRCERGAEIVKGSLLQFRNFVALDNEKAGLEMVHMTGSFGENAGSGVFDSLVVGYTELTPEGCSVGMHGIVAPKQEAFNIKNVTFVNYDEGNCSALSGCSQCKKNQGGYRAQVKELAFENSPNKLTFKWQHETIWIDSDGSLSGSAENSIVPSMGILPSEYCQMDVKEFSVNPHVPGATCSSALKFLRMVLNGGSIQPDSLKYNDLIITNPYGNVSVPYRNKRLTYSGWMALLFSKEKFRFEFDYADRITNISYEERSDFLYPDDAYIVEHQFFQTPDSFRTTKAEKNSTDSPLDVNSTFHGDYYWDEENRLLTYAVAGRTSRKKRDTFDTRPKGVKREIELKVYRCFYDGCIPPTVPPIPSGENSTFRWSQIETWEHVTVEQMGNSTNDTNTYPSEGDSITIPQGMRLIVDTAVPPLGRVYVFGILEFEDTMDHDFEASIIYIEGEVLAGESEDQPFLHNLTISLRGSLDPSNPDNVDMPMAFGTPNVGWKAIGVFGKLTLHGELPGNTWVKLGSTALPGDSEVILAEEIDPVFWIDKQVMITTSSKDPEETEICNVTSVTNGTILALDCALSYEHLGVTYSLPDGTEYSLASEVGLLSRNIKIRGVGSPRTDSFGGRILVSQILKNEVNHRGEARLSNVEFQDFGQDGFTGTYDPRYSIVFHGLGTETDGRNYLRKCSFNMNYNTAIGFFGSNNITVESNTIYHTVGASIRDDSEGNIYINNLLSVMLFPGTYNGRKETENTDWFGSFALNRATGVTLEGNVVSGSEQAAYQTYGENCYTESKWYRNEAHGVIYGVMLFQKNEKASPGSCHRLSNFYVWRAWDTAFYMQESASLLLENVISVESKIGVNQLVYGPPSLSHNFEDKTATTKDSIFVAASPSHTCDYQNSRPKIYNFYRKVLWPEDEEEGYYGILFGTFMSFPNKAPKHSFHGAGSYPAIRGGTFIENVTFAHFETRACGKDVALATNKDSDDSIHPIFTSEVTFYNTSEDNYIYMHEPSLSRVNPSDCVDMTCDGLKKVVLQDMDGSILGQENATVTSQAEFEWDGLASHGVGDYRIPLPMRQDINGSKIEATEKFPNKGIIRDDSCSLMESWRAWNCSSLRHRMLVIESMDVDTEIRRLSPIGMIANPGPNGYVDLLNGPMDRGWCMGYTCQERISTFYAIVAANFTYEVAMTSTPPQHIRLQLLHSDPDEAVILQIFFPKTQRYDVYVDGEFIPPKNIDTSQYPDKYQLLPSDSASTNYFPALTDIVGSNYLQRREKIFHLLLRGGHVVEIKMMPVVILNMGIVVDLDNFFEDDVVNNVAQLLGVSPANIRITNVVREDGGKRKRRRRSASSQPVDFEFEIGSPPLRPRTRAKAKEAITTRLRRI
ncbi:fibrocystin-L-like [Palaemon carinicauda]|uniref:fibrocystin-L-like n=1 Tax=Palaemon carinicauda TaxID=392227 RepID=UPI0035B5EC2E